MPTQRTIDNRRIRKHLNHGEGTRQVRISRNDDVLYRGHEDGVYRLEDNMWLYRGYRAEILLEVEELDRLDYCPQCGVKGEVVVNRMGCPECGASW